MFDVEKACRHLMTMGMARECLMDLSNPDSVTFIKDEFFNIYVGALGVTVFEG